MSRIATEAKVMADACQAAGVKLGYQSGGTRLGAVNTAIRDYISSGQLGNVYYGRQTSFRVRGRPGIDMPNFSPWFLNSSFSGGGSIYDIGVYQITCWAIHNRRLLAALLIAGLNPITMETGSTMSMNKRQF
ncbi:hypothetical protein CMK12_09660 [Candidatus Poribacteria bacterium]|nr:hypothetical protein [Candidatus Poribacteria bacterium]